MSEETRSGGLSAIWRFVASCRQMTERDRRNSWRACGWMAAWMVSFFSVALALKQEALPGGLWTYLAIAGSTALGLLALLAYVRFVREADELQRKIQLEASAFGFGGGFIATFALSLVERADLWTVDLGDPFLVMAVCYSLGLFLGARRYA